LSVSSGTVIRDPYYFYQGTYAIEVKLQNGKVVRYGELTGKTPPGVSSGSALQPGQTLGYIGTVSSGCCKPMLHFELYQGTKTGPLTQNGTDYQRRSDLMNPSSLLAEWEKAKFGVSY
jgi:murein DD-endopeptidase MepM/ murein hydrolase activator NlpD